MYYKIFDNKGPALKDLVKLEITSLVGRNFRKRKNRIVNGKANNPLLLDLGCGLNYTEGWINADFFKLLKLKFWKKYKNSEKIKSDLELDLRYPLNCPDNAVDGVYCGHVLEHMYPSEALNLLKEIFRILKRGAWLRINIPDLDKFIAFYNGDKSIPEFEERYQTGCVAMGVLTQESGHHSVWNEEFLNQTLSKVKFTNIRKVCFGKEGTDKRLIKEESHREWSTLVMEAQKPI